MTVPVPDRMQKLPFDPKWKLPVPWFVPWIDGKPEWKLADGQKHLSAAIEKRCWCCGQHLLSGANVAFVTGPLGLMNETTTEAPCHVECAQYAAQACPWLANPSAVRGKASVESIKPEWYTPSHPGVIGVVEVSRCGTSRVSTGFAWYWNTEDAVGLKWYFSGVEVLAVDREVVSRCRQAKSEMWMRTHEAERSGVLTPAEMGEVRDRISWIVEWMTDGASGAEFNAYRDGKVHVCKKMCSTCIFRPGNLMHLEDGRVEQMVESSTKDESAIICHKTLDQPDQAVCRGFWDKHRSETAPLRAAEALGVVEFVEIEDHHAHQPEDREGSAAAE